MTPEQLAQRFQQQRLAKYRFMKRVTLVIERRVKKRTPVKSGNTRRAITSRVERGGDRGLVGLNLPHGPALHDGSRPHIIRPTRAKALRFKSASGAIVFAKEVRHPGFKGIPFLKLGLKDAEGEIDQLAEEAGVELFTRIGR